VADDPLADITDAIADGRAVNWTSVPSDPLTADDRGLIEQLQVIDRIAQTNASGEWDAPIETFPWQWGPLTVLERIGGGNFGDVYRAHDARLDRIVALKLLRRHAHGDETVESVVIEEGRLLARIKHPNVVTVYGAERIGGRVGVWMEFIEGMTLEEHLHLSGPFEPEAVVKIGVALCRALDAVHEAGLLHRDLKAQNVLQTPDGRIVLTDFGAGRDELRSADGPVVELAGTPLYIAPEILKGQAGSVRCEIYGLGILLFHLATGSFPVQAATLQGLREAHARGAKTGLRQIRPRFPLRIAAAIERAIDANPSIRHGSAEELERALLAAAPTRSASNDSAGFGDTRRWWPFVAIAIVCVWGIWRFALGSSQDQSSKLVCDECFGPNVEAGGFAVSPDGRWIVAANTAAGDLRIRDVSTGKLRSVVLPASLSVDVPGSSEDRRRIANPVFSHDSKRLAFLGLATSVVSPLQLWTVDLDGGVPRLILGSVAADVDAIYDWASDGRSLLVSLQHCRCSSDLTEPPHELAWVSTDGHISIVKTPWGKITTIDEHRWNVALPPAARASPDGKYIAYAGPPETDTSNPIRHIYLLTSDGTGQQTDAVVTSAENENPAWSPRGDRLYFTSNVSTGIDLWSVAVTNGRAVGALTAERSDIGDAMALTVGTDGHAYYFRPLPQRDYIYLTDLAASFQSYVGQPVIKQVIAGSQPKWSDDGEQLRFLRRRTDESHDARRLWSVIALSLNNSREVIESIGRPLGGLFWYPPVRGLSLQQATDFWDEVERAPESFVYGSPTSTTGFLGDDEGRDLELVPAVVRDTAFAFRSDSTKDVRVSRIVAIDMATGKLKPRCHLPDRPAGPSERNSVGLSLSPDGRTLAIALSTKGLATLGTVNLDTCEYHPLYGPYRTEGTNGRIAWTPDGLSILISEESGEGHELAYQIFKVALLGGHRESVIALNGPDRDTSFDLSIKGLLALHPNPGFDQRFAGPIASRLQLWRLDLQRR